MFSHVSSENHLLYFGLPIFLSWERPEFMFPRFWNGYNSCECVETPSWISFTAVSHRFGDAVCGVRSLRCLCCLRMVAVWFVSFRPHFCFQVFHPAYFSCLIWALLGRGVIWGAGLFFGFGFDFNGFGHISLMWDDFRRTSGYSSGKHEKFVENPLVEGQSCDPSGLRPV